MNRSRFILTISGALVAVPMVTRAQVSTRPRRIGVLSPGPVAGEEFEECLAELKTLGWTPGENIFVEPRSAAAELSQLRLLADELVALKVDAIVTYGTEATASRQ